VTPLRKSRRSGEGRVVDMASFHQSWRPHDQSAQLILPKISRRAIDRSSRAKRSGDMHGPAIDAYSTCSHKGSRFGEPKRPSRKIWQIATVYIITKKRALPPYGSSQGLRAREDHPRPGTRAGRRGCGPERSAQPVTEQKSCRRERGNADERQRPQFRQELSKPRAFEIDPMGDVDRIA
jgi:hypothetical protein